MSRIYSFAQQVCVRLGEDNDANATVVLQYE